MLFKELTLLPQVNQGGQNLVNEVNPDFSIKLTNTSLHY